MGIIVDARATGRASLAVTIPSQRITIAGLGARGPQGIGVDGNSLVIGNYNLVWNPTLDTIDITYREV